MSALVTSSLTAIFPRNGGRGAGRRERLDFQFNPDELMEEIEAIYGSSLPYRGSHEVTNYSGTRSQRIPIELFYTLYGRFSEQEFARLETPPNQVSFRPIAGPGGYQSELRQGVTTDAPEGLNATLEGPARFLKSLMWNDPGRSMPQPPLVIFEWPGIIKLIGRVERLRLRYQQFEQETLQCTVMRANLLFREEANRLERITALGVRRGGSIRAEAVFESPINPEGGIVGTRQTVTVTQAFGPAVERR